MSSPSAPAAPPAPPRFLSRDRTEDAPEWLKRVQADERLALLRASSEFARTGYAPFLHKAKAASGADPEPTVRIPGRERTAAGVLGGVPSSYYSQVTNRRLHTDLPVVPAPAPAPHAPKLSKELKAGIAKFAVLKKTRRNDTAAVVDAVMGTAKKEASWAPADPIAGLKQAHRHAVADQYVTMPRALGGSGGGGATRRASSGAGGPVFSDTTAADAAEAAARQQVPLASEVLRRYKAFSVAPEHPAVADPEALLNPDAKQRGKVAPSVTAGSVAIAGHAELRASGTLTAVTPGADAVRSATLPLGSGAVSHALLQNRKGNAGRVAGRPVRRGGSGLVIGDVLVGHDQLLPATLIAAKWGRVANTEYGSAAEPCRLRVELQPLYVESLIKDLATALGPGAQFVTDVKPMVFLVDIGSANAAIHGHRPSGVPPPPLELHDSGSYRVAVGSQSFRGSRRRGGGGVADDEEASSSEEEVEVKNPPIVPGGPPIITKEWRRKKSHLAPLYEPRAPMGMADVVSAFINNTEVIEDDFRHRRRTKPKRPERPFDENDVRRAELSVAIGVGKDRANRLLLQLAKDGRATDIDRLLSTGFRADYTPNPWYEKMFEAERLRREAAEREAAGGRGSSAPPSPRATSPMHGVTPSDAPASAGDVAWAKREGHFLKRKKREKVPEVYVLPDVNAVDPHGFSPLMQAARNGNYDACVSLLRAGADHKRRSGDNRTALDLAAAENNTAALALAAHVPGAADRKRRAAKVVQLLDDRSIMVAAQQGDMRRVVHLVDHEQHSVAVANAYGVTPLHFAVMARDVALTEYLTARGADVNAMNNLNQSPWTLACDEPREAMRTKLKAAMGAGKKEAEREAAAAAVRAEGAAAREAQERHLVRELKTVTRGTTSAKAVQLALAGALDADKTSFAPLAGAPSLGLMPKSNTNKHLALALSTASSRAGAAAGSPRAAGASAPRSGSSLAGGGITALLASHSPRGVAGDGLTTRTITAAQKAEASASFGGLTAAWSRHMLNHLAKSRDLAVAHDAAVSRAAAEAAGTVAADRRRYGAARASDLSGATVGAASAVAAMGNARGPATLRHTERQEAARDTYAAALADPSSVSEHAMRLEPPPHPDSARFDAWMRMRFGVI